MAQPSQRLTVFLTMDLTETAPNGPGWYIRAFDENQPLMPTTPISTQAAYEASRGLQEALQSTDGEIPPIMFPHLVEKSSETIRQALEVALQEAEAQAAKVASLRKRLANFPAAKPTTS